MKHFLLSVYGFVECRRLRIDPTNQAQQEASFARGTSSEVGAHGAVANVKASISTTRDNVESTASVELYVRDAVREAKFRVELTTKDERAAQEALEAEGIASKHAINWAGEYAAEQVEQKLAPTLQKLQEWKMSVLHDPYSESRKAAQKAADPYQKAMMVTEKRINEYQQRAESLNSQAFALQGLAKGTAATAVAKQAAVDLEGAQTDMMNAHHMMAQAANFGAQAFKLQEKAKVLQINIPAYSAAAAGAAATTAYRYDPIHVPPPPVSPMAFNPPPPATNVFLQKTTSQQS